MKYTETRQTIFFVISIIIMIGLLIFGTTNNSVYILPNYPYFLGWSVANVMILTVVGMIGYDDE